MGCIWNRLWAGGAHGDHVNSPMMVSYRSNLGPRCTYRDPRDHLAMETFEMHLEDWEEAEFRGGGEDPRKGMGVAR